MKTLDGSTEALAELPMSGIERWLRSPWRRQFLILACVIVLTALSSRMWIESATAFGREIDWKSIVGRRLIDWGLWALFFEPIAWMARTSARLSRYWVVLVLIHVPLSVGVARAFVELDDLVTNSLFEPLDWGRRNDQAASPRDGDEVASAGDSLTPESAPREPQARPDRSRFKSARRDAAIMVYWVILGLAFSINTFLRNREQERHSVELELRASELEKELARAQLGNLRNQLHPHFLFNALHSVGGLIRENENRVALSALSNLGGLLRTILERGKSQEVTLVDELELLDQYLEIERLRLGERLQATTRIEPGLGRTKLPSLVLLPVVENAIKHGIAPRTEGGKIEISARREDGSVVLEVTDDGPGFHPGVLDDQRTPPQTGHTPIGLENTRKRLEALYGAAGGMRISNLPGGGARVLLWVPDRRNDA